MKVLIAIMAADNYLSKRNVSALMDTYIKDINSKKRKHEYEVVYYDGGHEMQEMVDVGYAKHLMCTSDDSIHGTYQKTIEAFDYFIKNIEFDVLVRSNISCYINIGMLDCVLDSMDTSCIYANKVLTVLSDVLNQNRLFPRGDFYMTGKDNIVGIVEHSDIPDNFIIDRVDDVMVGYAFANYFGKGYHDKLIQIQYSFCPSPYPKLDNSVIDEMKKNSLTYRVKTVPPKEKCSGYSWDYNEYREDDYNKIYRLHQLYGNAVYSKCHIRSIICPDESCGVPAVQIVNSNLSAVKRFLSHIS